MDSASDFNPGRHGFKTSEVSKTSEVWVRYHVDFNNPVGRNSKTVTTAT
jgi:hypothetical protein